MQKYNKNSQLKIAIFLSYRDPKEGGGYTITNDIFNELLKYPKKNIIFIVLNDKNNYLFSKIKKLGFHCKCFNENKIKIKFKNLFFSSFPFFLRIYNKFGFNKYLNFQLNNKISIVWFISAEYYFPLFAKYISTVWDLQHITHSTFPETGSFFRKIYRSVVIKSFLCNSFKIITGSKILIRILKKNYKIDITKFIYNPHPTPQIFIKEKRKKKYFNYKNYFLYPANFWRHKNHENLLKAFELFNYEHHYKYKLILVGDIKDFSYYNHLKKKFKKKLNKNFIILNFVSTNYLINLYDNCLGLIYSSFAGPENLPPLEAMARKKNIICSKYPGATEQLGNVPFYFDPNNYLSIKKALSLFVKSKVKKFFFIRKTSNYINEVLNGIKYF